MFKIVKKTKYKNIVAIMTTLVVFGSLTYTVFATTPDPGHPWTEVGDGTFIVTGPTVARTYTFPDSNATVLTTSTSVTPAQGGTGIGTIAQGDLLYSSASNTILALAKNTSASRYLSNTGSSNNPAWAQIDMSNGVTGALPVANGGTNSTFTAFTGPTTSTKTFTLPDASATILTSNTPPTIAQGGFNASLTPSNGGILYFNGSSASVLAGTATAGQVLRSGASAAPSWTTATYPATAGSAGTILRSDGTNFVSSTATYPSASGGIDGRALTSDGTNFSASQLPNQFVYGTVGLQAANLTAVTAMTSGTTYFQYIGAPASVTAACSVLVNVTTQAATITWAEVAFFKGVPTINGNQSLTLLGSTSVATTYNSTGIKKTTIFLSNIFPGDNIWVAFGSSATTPFQLRGMLADDIQSGVFQTAVVQPSLASSPQATTIAGATAVPARLVVQCV